MNTDKILKQYENAMEKYREDMAAYHMQMDEFHKDRAKCEKSVAKLIRIDMTIFDPKRKDGSISFHISRKGYNKIIKTYDKYSIEVKWPVEPDEPGEPYLQVSRRDTDVPF